MRDQEDLLAATDFTCVFFCLGHDLQKLKSKFVGAATQFFVGILFVSLVLPELLEYFHMVTVSHFLNSLNNLVLLNLILL